MTSYMAVYAASYIDAMVVAIASRLWPAATELAPGLIYFALSKRAASTT